MSNGPNSAGRTTNHSISVLDPAAISNHPLTKLLLKEKLQNVKTNRNFPSGNLSWNLLLEQINAAYPDMLFLPYICKAGLQEVSL